MTEPTDKTEPRESRSSAPSVPELLQRAHLALVVYQRRGMDALTAFAEDGDAESFLAALKKRDVAFHNFRAVEDLVVRAGGDVGTYGPTRALWPEIESLNATLAGLMAEALARLSAKIGKVRLGKAGTQAYRSGMVQGPRLVKIV